MDANKNGGSHSRVKFQPLTGLRSSISSRPRAGDPVKPLTRVERDEKGCFTAAQQKPLLTLLLARSGAVAAPAARSNGGAS